MNRRNRKKKEISLFDDLKARIANIDTGKVKSQWQRLPKFHQRALMILTPLLLILLVLPVPEAPTEAPGTPQEATRTEVAVNTVSLSEEGGSKQVVTTTDDWKEYTVQAGDTLSKVFRANSLPITDLNALVKIEGLDKPLSKIKQGQLVRFKMTSDGHLDILQLEKSGSSVMFFRLSDGGYGRSK